MVAHITAAARTPWAVRGGALAAAGPEHLLQAAVRAAVLRAGIAPETIDRVLVACDTTVGAQDLNIGRRAVLDLGWVETPAVTTDGQGVGGLALVGMAARLGGCTVVAGVDATSVVPPGAGQVRDYGRPVLDLPEVEWLEKLAAGHHLTRAQIDEVASSLRVSVAPMNESIVTVGTGQALVEIDAWSRDANLSQLEALTGPGGLQTAAHIANYADGAAAVVVESDGGGGREILHHGLRAGSQASVIERMAELMASEPDGNWFVADHSAVAISALQTAGVAVSDQSVPSTLAVGSTPSINGLRLLVDVFNRVTGNAAVVSRGSMGQIATVSIASR